MGYLTHASKDGVGNPDFHFLQAKIRHLNPCWGGVRWYQRRQGSKLELS